MLRTSPQRSSGLLFVKRRCAKALVSPPRGSCRRRRRRASLGTQAPPCWTCPPRASCDSSSHQGRPTWPGRWRPCAGRALKASRRTHTHPSYTLGSGASHSIACHSLTSLKHVPTNRRRIGRTTDHLLWMGLVSRAFAWPSNLEVPTRTPKPRSREWVKGEVRRVASEISLMGSQRGR